MTTHPLPLPGASHEIREKGPSRSAYSLRKAIDTKCRECIYDSCAAGRWREQVAACELTACALWPVRPKSRGRA